MAEKEIEINFKPKGLAEMLSMQNKLKNSVLDTTVQINRSDIALESVAKTVKEIKSDSEDVTKPFESLLSAIIPGGNALVKYNRNISAMVDNFTKVQKAGGFFKVFSSYLGGVGEKAQAMGGFMKSAFGGGMTGAISKIGVGFKSLIPVIAGLGISLGPILIVIGAIVAIVFTLSRMWKNNIGGMQTFWFRFVGAIKDVWHRFVIGFDKLLRALSPLFKILFTVIFLPLMVVVKTIGILFDALFLILQPIFDVIGEIGQTLLEPFEMLAGPGGNGALDMLAMIGDGVKLLAKALGFLLKWALFPVLLVFKGLAVILTPIAQMIKYILDGAKKLGGLLGLGKEADTTSSKGAKSINALKSQPINSSQVVNRNNSATSNNNVIINSSGPISEKNAPAIGNVIVSSLTSGRRAGSG